MSPTPPTPPVEQMKLMEAENEQNKHAYSVAIATAVAAEAAVAAAQAAAEVVRLTAAACNSGKSKEEIAAIRIQTAFRGYLVGCLTTGVILVLHNVITHLDLFLTSTFDWLILFVYPAEGFSPSFHYIVIPLLISFSCFVYRPTRMLNDVVLLGD